jgi:hypothetical protein
MARQRIFASFPRLDPADFFETSPRTSRYNCIAYAAGDEHRWWWPDPDGIYYWPHGVQRSEHLAAFQRAFETLGYTLASDGSVEPGYEKVAIFALGTKPTHAAKQLPNGRWSSKLGS